MVNPSWECEGPYCVPDRKGGADCSDCPLCRELEEAAAREYHNMEVSPVYFPSDRVEVK